MKKKVVVLLILLALTIFIGYSYYMLKLEKYMSEQDTVIFGQNKLSPSSTASLRIVTLNHKNQEPIPNAEIGLVARSKETKEEVPLYSGKTDEHGTASISFSVPELAEGDYDLVISTKSKMGKDSFIKLIKIEKAFKILLTTDKPIYQPGQTIYIRALTFSTLTSKPAGNEEITVEVEDSKGNKVFKKKIRASEYGIIGTNFTLADELNLGLYTIRATLGGYSSEKKVNVERYVLPKFKVGFSTDKTYYLPNQVLKGVVSANYFFGKPASNAEVNVKVYTYEISMEQIADIKGETDENGHFNFEYDLPSSFIGVPLEKGSSLVFFNISVTDQAEHKETITKSVPIAKDPIEIELIPESGTLAGGIENIVYAVTTYPDGKPAETTLTVKGRKFKTNRLGIAEINIVPEKGSTSVTVSAEDSQGNKGSRTETFTSDYQEENILLRADKSVYNVGDSAKLDIFYNKDRGTVYVDVIKDKQTILTKAVDIKDKMASLYIDLDEMMAGSLEIHAYKILRSSDITRDSKTIFVNPGKDIELSINLGKDSYLPGEDATIGFLTKKDNNPVPTAIGVNIVDESVFALQEKEAGFEKLYFALEKELLEPRYMIYGITLPTIICEEPIPEPLIKTQAENILFAQAPSVDRFGIKTSSIVEKEQEIKLKKQRYFGGLGKFIYWLTILVPLLIAGLTVYSYRNRKKTLLKEFGLSIPVLIGLALLIGFLFLLTTMLIPHAYSWQLRTVAYTGELVVLVIGIIATGILISWSNRNDHYKTFLISCFLLPVEIALLLISFSSLTDHEEVLFIGMITLLGIVLISSLVLMIRHTKREYEIFFLNSILYPIYVMLLVLFGFSMALGEIDIEMIIMKKLLWLGITASLIPLAFMIYSLEAIKNRQKIAVASIFLALLFILPLAGPLLIMGGGFSRQMQFAAEGQMELTAIGERRFMEAMPSPEAKVSETEAGVSEKPRVRQYFPETLYSNPQIITDEDGKASIGLKAADSITTWRVTALASSLNGGIGSGTEEMLVFQDFFIDIDLPVSLTQNDEVSIPIAVYNYLPSSQDVRLELVQEPWFELLDEKEKTLTIGSNDVTVAYYRIKVKQIGVKKVTVYAYGTKMSDAISRDIEIVPDGKEFRISYSDRLDKEIDKTIAIPEPAIENSEKLFIKIYPGIFSQVVEGLDSMLRMPHGCFEQTSSITYPNVLVLNYMKSTKQITPETQFKAEQYIGTGYQRLMTFEATRGGFSIFGKAPAEKIVTAYGLLEFVDMAKIYEIDDGLIPRVQEWLLSQMEGNHWTPDGNYGAAYKSRNSDIAATCYITWSLLNSGVSHKDERIQKALGYIEKNYASENDNPYALGLCALSLSKGKREAKPILQRLGELAKRDDKTLYWTSKFDSHGSIYTERGNGAPEQADVETTAVVALAYLEEDYEPNDLTRILQFLINNKDSYGTWGSTQATVLTLKALTDSIAKTGEKTDAKITVLVNNQEVKEIKVNDENNDVLHLVDLKPYAKKGNTNVKIRIEGKGRLFYQIVSSYYVDWKDSLVLAKPGKTPLIDIKLDYDKTSLKTDDIATANVDVRYLGPGVVNYAIVDLGIPPGFRVFSDDLTKAKQDGLIERYDMTGRQLILYLENLDQKGIQLSYRLVAKYPIKAKTPKSKVYDYYNPEVEDEAEPVEMNVV